MLPIYGVTANLKALDPTIPLVGAEVKERVKMLTLQKPELTGAKREEMTSPTAAGFVGTTQNIVLEGVFQNSHNKQTATVVINGKALKINDYIDGYRLEAINDTAVVLRSPTEQIKLSLFTSIVIK